MTTKQQQCLLCYLGYYNGTIDGIWGAKSTAAAMAFQRNQGMAATGVLDKDTEVEILKAITSNNGDWWEEIVYFDRSEFACKCGRYCDGYPAEMDETVVKVADRVRKHFGSAAIVSSGLRCAKHNANVGGVSNSRHLSGKAVDFCVTGKTAAQVLAFVRQQPEIRYTYAIDGQFVHMDVM